MIFITILQLIAALILILVVLFQSGKSQGLSGAIGGIADSYMAKSKAKSLDAKLAKGTKWVGAVFIILTWSSTACWPPVSARKRIVSSDHPEASLRGDFLCPPVGHARLRRHALQRQQLRHGDEHIPLLLQMCNGRQHRVHGVLAVSYTHLRAHET